MIMEKFGIIKTISKHPTFVSVLFPTEYRDDYKAGDSPIDYFNGFAVFEAPIYACGKYLADKLGFIYDTLTEDPRDVGFFLRRNIGLTRYVILHVFPYKRLNTGSFQYIWIACLKGLESKAKSAAYAIIDWDKLNETIEEIEQNEKNK